MSRRRIVLIGGDGGRSGVPSHISHLCDALCEDAEITVISDVDRGGFGFARQFRHIEIPGLATSVNPAAAWSAASMLREALASLAPDLVWAHARMSLPLSRWALRRGDLGRLMVTYHGLPFGTGHGLAKSLLSKGIEAASLRIATPHDVIFLTDEDRITMTPWVAEHRLHVLPNCSWLGGFEARAGLEPESRHLVMITRDSGQKNLDLAAKIFAQLPEDFRLSLFGMGTDSPALRSRFAAIMAAGALRRVQFRGETADVRGALQGATGLLVSSRYEGLSISMIEAMEMGLPVFSTPVGGTALIGRVHPSFGLLSDDVRSSAVVIDQMTAAHILSPVENAERIHAAWAENFAPEAWTRRVRDLVDRVLERPADQPTLDDTPT